MSFNLEVLGGKNYLLPTGGKYCPQDIAIAAIGGKEGLYSWAKSKKVLSYPVVYSAMGMNNTTVDGVFNLVAASGDGWGKHYMYSESLNHENTEFEVVHTLGTLQATYFIGFAETAQSQYANITHSVMLESGQVKRYNGATLVGQIGTVAVGDTIKIKVKGGTISVYKADTLLTSFSHSLNTLVLNLTFYQGAKNYGTLLYTTTTTNYGFVVDDDPNAYPNGGKGPDGFYYEKASKMEMKYATGTSGNVINVTGLDFKPQSIFIYGYWYNSGSYHAWGNLMFNGDEILNQTSGFSAGGMAMSNISVSDDGFTVTMSSTQFSFTWHALGY